MNKTLTSLSRDHRRTLETTVARAREAAESGAAKAVQALGVGAAAAPGHLNAEQTRLRVALRAHGRQIGDRLLPDGKAQSVDHLVVEQSYQVEEMERHSLEGQPPCPGEEDLERMVVVAYKPFALPLPLLAYVETLKRFALAEIEQNSSYSIA